MADGGGALSQNTTGTANTAVGSAAMTYNTTGSENVAVGLIALGGNTTGSSNVAIGWYALNNIVGTTGSNNVAVGTTALGNGAAGGSNNTALGANAGVRLTSGSFNIMIGNQGLAADDHVIRIGDVQAQTFVAGISGVNVSGVPVLVSSSGQLGIASSSRRFKENIDDMGDASNGLLLLRPVTFRYKEPYADGSKPLDYGLIAEEVEEIYPDLVVKGKGGRVETVQYQKLTPMLLNELQKEHQQIQEQAETIRMLQARLAALEVVVSGRSGQ